MVKCKNCGHDNSPTAKHCEKCGISLDLKEPKAKNNSNIPVVKTGVAESLIKKNRNNSEVVSGADESEVVPSADESLVKDGADESELGVGADESELGVGADESELGVGADESLVEANVNESELNVSAEEFLNKEESEKLSKGEINNNETTETEIKPFATADNPFNFDNIDFNTEKYSKNPVLAFLLSLIFLCLGQFYNGQILKGILFVVIIFVLFNIFNPVGAILGIMMIIYSAIDAYRNAKAITENNGNYFYTNQKGC